MGRRTVLEKYLLLNAQDTASPITSESTDISGLDNISYQLIVGASVNAILEVQFCNDRILSPSSVFKPLDFGTPISIIGATDADYTISVENQGFKHMRLSTENNGGTGTLSAWVTGLALGA